MRMTFGIAVVAALLAAPVAVHAQGVIGGMQRGAAQGNYVAGPVGGVVGGAVGGAVGGVNGALGINPGPRYEFSFGLLPPLIITTIAGTITTDRSGKKTARDALPTGGRATAAPLQLSFDVRLVVQNDIQQGRETRSSIG